MRIPLRTPKTIVATAAAVGAMVLAVVIPSTVQAIDARSTEPVAAAPAKQGKQVEKVEQVQVDFAGDFLGWAMLDRATGAITSSHNMTQTSSTESMIKVWLVADALRLADAAGRTPSQDTLAQASRAIRHSDDHAAQLLYRANGGDASVQRMIDICKLTDTRVYGDWWSRTTMSPRDAVRLADCIANGTAAGSKWTGWLLAEMRQVTGTTADSDQQATTGGGRWGIIDGVPTEVAKGLAIKNGWTAIGADDSWHLNCLAIHDGWTMAVMMRYPISQGLDYGAQTCARVAEQLVPQP